MNLSTTLPIIISGLFLTPVALAANETHFDLSTQNFSEAMKEGEMISARYNLPKSYVTTNLKHDSTYHTLNDNGFFKVELKKPLTTWGVSLDMGYTFYSGTRDKRSIIFTADNGTALTIGLSYRHSSVSTSGVFFNGTYVYDTDADERLSITINKDNTDTVTVNINGQEVASISKPSFSKLKFVEAQLIREQGDNDAMHSLIIAGE
jgi:hypothetical protein